MCSVAGSPTLKETKKMLKSMRHRAPDGERFVCDKKFSMGMGRLSIIDLKSPGLCLYNEDKYWLSFNGEIYNYLELKKELKEKGHLFTTNSDTEVLVKSYLEWGVKCLDKFNGMFAFAIYDGDTVFLARDIVGEKPLYYKKYPFKFASEAKALNWDCEEFPPAHYGVYDFKTNELKIKRYWELQHREINPITAVDELDWLLSDSIKLRTRSDVPYALYFSGGVDSSLISTYHDFHHLFTYNDDDYKKEFKKVFPKILWHLDYPVSSFSPFGLWKLAEEASKNVKVVISGEGADELFGGYIRYVLPDFNSQAQEIWPSYKKLFEPAKNVNQSGWEEFNGNLRELLRMGDRMSSAFGIENRCPFLDRRIIEFAFSLPASAKIKGFDTKWILQALLRLRKPTYKPIEKKGLYCSVNSWLGEKDPFDKKKYREYQEKIWRKFRSS